MTITIDVDMGYEFAVRAKAREVFELLSNVPASASHYPQVQKLTDLGDNAFRWDMQPIGIGSLELQTVYASRYVSDPKALSVHWTPLDHVGNARVSGHWQITPKKQSTHVVLMVQGALTLPLPALMKMVAAPMVEAEFERLTEHYIHNLTHSLGGEV